MGRNSSTGQRRRLGEASADSRKHSRGTFLIPEPNSVFTGWDVHELNITPSFRANAICAKTRRKEMQQEGAMFDLNSTILLQIKMLVNMCVSVSVCVKLRWWNRSRNILEVLWLTEHLSSTSGAVSASHHSGSGSDEVLIHSTWKQVHLSAEVGRMDGSWRLGGSFKFKWSRNWMKSFKQYKWFISIFNSWSHFNA